ncbi:MAG: YihY family inner membrane protein [Thiotrichales bacterium]|nr:YihY family inner membrane protein [Thiotrichales bacterium]
MAILQQKIKLLRKPLFWKSVVLRFYKVKGLDAIVILSYTSLLSLVPLLGLMLSIFSVSTLFDSLSKEVMDLLVRHLLPQSEETIQHYLWQFSQQVARLKGPSLVFILITTLILLWTVDDKLNSIWSTEQSRRWWVSLLHYLGISLLGPLLLGGSLVMSSYLTALPLISHVQAWVSAPLDWLHALPVLFNVLGLLFLYRFVPIVQVSWISALIGATLAALLLEGLKAGFVLYLDWFPTYSLIYGAFAAIPILLLWIYSLWFVIMICATVVFQLENFEKGSKLKSTLQAHARKTENLAERNQI